MARFPTVAALARAPLVLQRALCVNLILRHVEALRQEEKEALIVAFVRFARGGCQAVVMESFEVSDLVVTQHGGHCHRADLAIRCIRANPHSTLLLLLYLLPNTHQRILFSA